MLNRLNRYTSVILRWCKRVCVADSKQLPQHESTVFIFQLGKGNWRREGTRELLETVGLVLYLEKT